ncbi:hypothetical protein B0T10DRAFT_186235 [Thelonectria olida]|uniref:Cupredoxin n=1 Tax=Thelonectria olida TaxID=1576542 RepID=A0A9P8WEB3_9HYPO|nr:hypothetical protein B0T10DRAFT_186235 [Thelonectria olida]
MKYSTTLALAAAMAPLSSALSVGEPLSYWPARRDGHKGEEKGDKGDKEVIEVDLSGSGYDKKYGGSKTNIIIIWVNGGNGAETTTINEKVTVTETVTAGGEVTETPGEPPAAAATHTVTVGGPGGLIYQPDQLQDVPIGDTVIFEFLSQNHTVTQSSFDLPCDPLAGGMDSSFMANPNNTVSPPPQIAMQVMVDTPLWFYCRQANHCGMGMTFSINPTEDKTQAMFQAAAIKQKGDGSQTPITDPSATPAESQVEEPAATSTAEAPPAQGTEEAVTPGKGTMDGDGSCVCIVTCAGSSFPAAAQGVGAFGGVAGGLPLNMAAIS